MASDSDSSNNSREKFSLPPKRNCTSTEFESPLKTMTFPLMSSVSEFVCSADNKTWDSTHGLNVPKSRLNRMYKADLEAINFLQHARNSLILITSKYPEHAVDIFTYPPCIDSKKLDNEMDVILSTPSNTSSAGKPSKRIKMSPKNRIEKMINIITNVLYEISMFKINSGETTEDLSNVKLLLEVVEHCLDKLEATKDQLSEAVKSKTVGSGSSVQGSGSGK